MSKLHLAPIIARRYYKYYFSILWLAIGLISSVDLYWAIKNQCIIAQNEENPIGRYLIQLDQGEVALFMGIKMAGTILTLGILIFLYHWRRLYAWTAIVSLSIVQFWLLHYLGR
jgi:hypothetical protein